MISVRSHGFAEGWHPPRNHVRPSIHAFPRQFGSGFSSYHSGGVQFAMGDGSVRFIPKSIAQATLEALATRAGGEVANLP